MSAIVEHVEDSQLAMELAQEISERSLILERHGLTEADLLAKLRTPAFQRMYTEARRAWKSDMNVRERLKLKAQHLVEDSLLPLYGIVHDSDIVASTRIDAFKKLAEVANVDKMPAGTPKDAGAGVSITFNIGQDRAELKNVTIHHEALPDAEGSA